jgi:hypothetical protein
MSLPDRTLIYTSAWNLSTIPADAFASEVGRRRGAQRKVRTGGRPAIPTPCLKCGIDCAGVVAAKRHCPARPLSSE